AKPVELKPVFKPTGIVSTSNQPKRPKEDVKASNPGSSSPAPATVAAPPTKVQTGGFGDPNGIPGIPTKEQTSTKLARRICPPVLALATAAAAPRACAAQLPPMVPR
ncbi:MAG TPA: hypothetical protein VNB49_14950, partial [Candidatus Dormibacteraeota bacterium]|nr:hypothetical protein [Candidatus Dormibacteraeota bacterium]